VRFMLAGGRGGGAVSNLVSEVYHLPW
jgi:hypothetical protein